jgi:hypothetical protein
MGVLNRALRLQIMLNPAELQLVDNWRFLKRMPSRASAVRELLERGLMAEGFEKAEDGAHSKDFGLSSEVAKPKTLSRPSSRTR